MTSSLTNQNRFVKTSRSISHSQVSTVRVDKLRMVCVSEFWADDTQVNWRRTSAPLTSWCPHMYGPLNTVRVDKLRVSVSDTMNVVWVMIWVTPLSEWVSWWQTFKWIDWLTEILVTCVHTIGLSCLLQSSVVKLTIITTRQTLVNKSLGQGVGSGNVSLSQKFKSQVSSDVSCAHRQSVHSSAGDKVTLQ